MKKLVLLLVSVVLTLFSACSVQENMNADIFFDRLSKNCELLDFENAEKFIKDNRYYSFIKDLNETEYAFEITLNEVGDAEKIAVSCEIEKVPQSLMTCVESVIKTYSPDDNAKEVLSVFWLKGKVKLGNLYHETQWRKYSCYVTESDFFFSVTNKKLVNESGSFLSLKPNDRVDF